ncbi:hypothetical protein ACNVED_11010 [Legionella sp. D16C41]|uniref:hypothetical protein n=1 Tax=Legionella sp. D16C41 TaxID=3402688 RepID=UPI003AF7A085
MLKNNLSKNDKTNDTLHKIFIQAEHTFDVLRPSKSGQPYSVAEVNKAVKTNKYDINQQDDEGNTLLHLAASIHMSNRCSPALASANIRPYKNH